ncbi:serine/threonine-protein kinase [Streptomyces sp. LBL]|uniref:serine/threonine-protein kinase n=1 Tax=Streptomyces sp. LBL TaxID=2940562 RepID=UPI0024760372|nr:serine/threonine-protein kinase [Streptomyces sp. LBL]
MGTEWANSRVIAGRYRLEAQLGRGGMGVVWRASDQLLGRSVAVKELPLDETLSAEGARRQRERTLREASAVAQLSHPHIIVVHDVVEHDERPYIVMELIEGGSLAERIAAHGPVDADEAARIGIALLGALRAAHAAGVLHRDIKPANVLVEEGTGRVVLTDFGIAQVAGAATLTETGAFVGSPEYTAPERMSGAGTGPPSDLWSLGALLCTVLSGESPFRRDSLGGILHAVVSAEIRPPAQATPILSVVRGLLERDPDRRLDAERAERMLRTFRDTGRTPSPPPPGRTHTLSLGRARTGPADDTPATPPGHTPKPPSDRPSDLPSDLPSDRPSDLPSGSAPPQPDEPARPPAAFPWRSPRGVLITALLVAAMAGAGVSAAALLMSDGANGAGTRMSSAPYSSTSASASPSPSPSTSTRPSPSGGLSGGPSGGLSGGLSPSGSSAPSGYHLSRDPAGFMLAVPDGFTREPQGERIFYMSPWNTFRLGIRVADPDTGAPLTVLRRAAAEGPDTNPGYREGRVTRVAHRGRPAALWEFTWDGFSAAEGPRHTYDLCWEEDGRLYDVWVSAPVVKVPEAKEYFDVAVDTLVTGR